MSTGAKVADVVAVPVLVAGIAVCAIAEPCGAATLGGLFGCGTTATATQVLNNPAVDNGLPATDDGIDIGAASFAQTTASNSFSSGGAFSGQTITDVADKLRSGAMTASDVPIQVIVRGGNTLILNTRSALALQQAGIPRSQWLLDNVTGDPAAEARLSGQLASNGLGSGGTGTVRVTGGG
jgi:hypothetical protein